MIVKDDLVSVVIPAYNAAATLDATLQSVRAQTHQNLEIVVVDDGSLDGTARIALSHAARDPRVCVVRQANRGVAAARNRGVAETRGRWIAPIDADDLWAPAKIERQLAAMRRGNGRVGLVYAWFVVIDSENRILVREDHSEDEGSVIEALCLRNIVGNGSSALMLREAVEAAGGYDETLRARGAQGCEDYKLYFTIAQRYEFALVRDILIGYRQTPGNMSDDLQQMLRSRDLCIAEFTGLYPQLRAKLRRGRSTIIRILLNRSVRAGRTHDTLVLLQQLLRHDPLGGVSHLSDLAARATIMRWRPSAVPSASLTFGSLFQGQICAEQRGEHAFPT